MKAPQESHRVRRGSRLPKQTESPSDERLIQQIKEGNHRALETIFNRHLKNVYRQACKIVENEADAEEVVQDVFLTIHKKANFFRGQAAFSTWLYRLTVNAALTKLRRRKKGEEVFLDDYLPRFRQDGHHEVRPVVDWSEGIDELLARTELQRTVRQAIDMLPPLDKSVLVMSDLDGVPNREIGDTLGLSLQAVKARLHRARLFLRGKLAVHFGHSPA